MHSEGKIELADSISLEYYVIAPGQAFIIIYFFNVPIVYNV